MQILLRFYFRASADDGPDENNGLVFSVLGKHSHTSTSNASSSQDSRELNLCLHLQNLDTTDGIPIE